MATLNNPRSDVIASTIEPDPKVNAGAGTRGLFRNRRFQDDFMPVPKWFRRPARRPARPGKAGRPGTAMADFKVQIGPRGGAVKIPVRMTGGFQAGL